VGKIAEKTVYRSVFLTKWDCNLIAESLRIIDFFVFVSVFDRNFAKLRKNYEILSVKLWPCIYNLDRLV